MFTQTHEHSNLMNKPKMQFEYDPEKLINEIRKRPGIWDSGHEHYRAQSIRCKLWMEVIKEMLDGSVTLCKSEMRELEIQLQKKWKCIRDSHMKYINNPRTKRPYIYSKYLTFLNSQVKDGSKTITIDDTDGEPPCKTKRKNFRKGHILFLSNKEMSDDDNENVDCNESDEVLSNNSNEFKKEFIDTEAPEQSQAFAFANVESRSKDDSEDCDRMFLLSLLPHLKSIPEEFRLNVKMELMQVLKTAQQSISVLPHKLF